MFFERFNVAGFTYIERPLAILYAANLISGVVIEVNQDETDIISCFESQLHHSSSLTIPIGTRDCERYLAHILRSNPSVIGTLSPPELPIEGQQLDMLLVALARFLWQSGYIKIPLEGDTEKEDDGNIDIAALLVAGKERSLIEAAGFKKKNQQSKADKEREKEMAAMDMISVDFRDFPPITIGRERHRFCDPLFEPSVLSQVSIPVETVLQMDGSSLPTPPVPKDPDFILPIQSAVHSVVTSIPFTQRPHVYFGIVLTGPLANIHGEHVHIITATTILISL
jgi:actin-related protein 9